MVQAVNDSEEQEDSQKITMKSLLEAGVHFGHQKKFWNPKMQKYIFTHRNGVHIIDLQQSIGMIEDAANFLSQVAFEGKKILMVGTKKQAQDVIINEAERSSSMYISNRWLGGTLTNFQTIKKRIAHLISLETQRENGDFEVLTKRESLKIDEKNTHLSAMYSGNIIGIGPRYCPSIEDKVSRFKNKESHQIFIEPEGINKDLVYPNGISTSLPKKTQESFIFSIKGLENAKITKLIFQFISV